MDIEIRCDTQITKDNYGRVHIEIYKNGEYEATFSPWFISYDLALMLTSGIPSLVKQGYEIYKSNVKFHMDNITNLFNN